MPRHPMPHIVDSPASSPASSLKHSPSKREKVKQLLRRVSSIGHRNKHSREQSLSQSFSAAETQASGSERGAHSPEPTHPLIDLTVDAPVAIPVKVAPRRGSTASSVGSALRHKAGRLTADDGSSFHSSSPSESSASDAQSLKSSHKQEAARSPHVEPAQPSPELSQVTSPEEPTPEAAPAPCDQHEIAGAVERAAAPVEDEANPVPPVFLSEEEPKSTPAPGAVVADVSIAVPTESSETVPAQEESAEPLVPSQLTESFEFVKDPFDDAYAADGESDASASPELGPIASVDNDIDNMELNKPDEAPLPVEPPAEPEVVEVSESPERVVEVSKADDDAIVSATVETETVPTAEPEDLEATTPTPTAIVPPSELPYVVVVAPSPISASDPAALAEQSTPSPSPSSSSSKSTPSPSQHSYPPPATPTATLLTPLTTWLHSRLTTLKHIVPARRFRGFRWRVPFCYSLAVVCYSLTWYLHRRPPQDVGISHFEMY